MRLTPFYRPLLAMLLVGAIGAKANADGLKSQEHLFEIGPYAGALFIPNDHDLVGGATFMRLKDVALDVGLRFGYLPVPFFGLELEGGVMPAKTETDKNAILYHARAHILFQYPARVAPFVVAGAGLFGVASDSDALGNDPDGEFHWGLGLKAYVTRWMALRIDGRHIVTDGSVDGRRGSNTLANSHFEALGGISFVLGWEEPPKDTDGDGLTDDKDKCPDEPAQTPDGCPPRDSDGDGLTDDKDKCPHEPAQTPDGCPPKDTDGDGLTDDKDKCPEEPAQTPDGCPPKDSDGDGFTDDKDQCPNEPETKNGYEDNDGCPDTLPQAVKKFTGTIRGITFAFNKAKIRRSAYATLNGAVKVLSEYKGLKLIIRGHTDSRGSREYNLDLSRRRAEAVKDFLVTRGIEASRFTTEGLGPDEPIDTNKTAKGRAENRRIEFKINTAP